jgi:hypothetical protein
MKFFLLASLALSLAGKATGLPAMVDFGYLNNIRNDKLFVASVD